MINMGDQQGDLRLQAKFWVQLNHIAEPKRVQERRHID
jgi:predicted DNA-binding ribbon-helix-helix protein